MSILLPVESREYKLILNSDRFSQRSQGCKEFLEIVEFLAGEYGGEFKVKQDEEEDERRTWYVDTSDLALQQQKFVLRVREEKNKEKYKVMLKYRSPDRYLSALQPVNSPRGNLKFEEDITPPFISKFSKSCSLERPDKPALKTFGDIVELFPGLKSLDISLNSPVKAVNGFIAHEIAHEVGLLKFSDQKPSIKVGFSFWYLFERAEGFPLIGEFSFDHDTPNSEDFPIEVIRRTNQFFIALQKQVGWLDFNNATKTAYAYESL